MQVIFWFIRYIDVHAGQFGSCGIFTDYAGYILFHASNNVVDEGYIAVQAALLWLKNVILWYMNAILWLMQVILGFM